MRAIELGCGTAYVSSWLARRGAEIFGVDNSAMQLATAERLSRAHKIPLTLHHGNAETVPYPDAYFDFAISEYGAAIWCDPLVWIPEAHRLLKPGGELVFLGSTPLSVICTPPNGAARESRLHRSYFDLRRLDWRDDETDPGGIEFNLPISAWLKLFRETGFRGSGLSMSCRRRVDSPDRYGIFPVKWADVLARGAGLEVTTCLMLSRHSVSAIFGLSLRSVLIASRNEHSQFSLFYSEVPSSIGDPA